MTDRRRLFAALTLAALAALALTVPALTGGAGGARAEAGAAPEVVDGYARATPPGAMAGAVYGTIRSVGPADRLLAVSSPVAARAMIHDNVDTDGVMQMRPVEGLEIPAGGAAVLAPGGMHIMLMGLKAPLVVDENVEIQLEFERAGAVRVSLPVVPLSAG